MICTNCGAFELLFRMHIRIACVICYAVAVRLICFVSFQHIRSVHSLTLTIVFRLVLYKEQNMLLTEQQLSRRRGIIFPQPDRIQKVKKSLGAIRQVMGERKKDKLSQMVSQQMNEQDGSVVDDKETEHQ